MNITDTWKTYVWLNHIQKAWFKLPNRSFWPGSTLNKKHFDFLDIPIPKFSTLQSYKSWMIHIWTNRVACIAIDNMKYKDIVVSTKAERQTYLHSDHFAYSKVLRTKTSEFRSKFKFLSNTFIPFCFTHGPFYSSHFQWIQYTGTSSSMWKCSETKLKL